MAKKKAIVLGCGLVGQAIARDMAADGGFDVTVADISESTLQRLTAVVAVKTLRADLSDPSVVRNTVKDFDLVLGALPSRFGFAALGAVIESRKPYCDISFMPSLSASSSSRPFFSA